jgi:hypothetical protein
VKKSLLRFAQLAPRFRMVCLAGALEASFANRQTLSTMRLRFSKVEERLFAIFH